MKMVINILEYDKEWIQNAYGIPQEINVDIAKAIINGKPYNPERPKGHWIFDFAHNKMTCSKCGRTFTGGFDLDNADNFCRHCGADMRGKETDCDYERAVEQLEHDMLYEPTFNQDDGSM